MDGFYYTPVIHTLPTKNKSNQQVDRRRAPQLHDQQGNCSAKGTSPGNPLCNLAFSYLDYCGALPGSDRVSRAANSHSARQILTPEIQMGTFTCHSDIRRYLTVTLDGPKLFKAVGL